MFIATCACSAVEARFLQPEARFLLEHDESMTARLERFHRQRMRIHIIDGHMRGPSLYERETVMVGCDDNMPKQVAHIRIRLDLVAEIRAAVIAGKVPFGRLLAEHAIVATSHDREILMFAGDSRLAHYLRKTRPQYPGRRHRLVSACNENLADIIEVLPNA